MPKNQFNIARDTSNTILFLLTEKYKNPNKQAENIAIVLKKYNALKRKELRGCVSEK